MADAHVGIGLHEAVGYDDIPSDQVWGRKGEKERESERERGGEAENTRNRFIH
jgi:hypothetical protein